LCSTLIEIEIEIGEKKKIGSAKNKRIPKLTPDKYFLTCYSLYFDPLEIYQLAVAS
jgi:hypothetical protein